MKSEKQKRGACGMITSVRWVPVGAARSVPIKEDLDAEMAVTEHMLAQQQAEAAAEALEVQKMVVDGEEDDEEDEEPLLKIGEDVRAVPFCFVFCDRLICGP